MERDKITRRTIFASFFVGAVILTGCADTPRAAYDRLNAAVENLDPNAYAKTITGPPARVAAAYAALDYLRSLKELEDTILATRGQGALDKFAEMSVDEDRIEREGTKTPAFETSSQPARQDDLEKQEKIDSTAPTFVVEGNIARVQVESQDTGERLIRMNGKWYYDIEAATEKAPEWMLLSVTTMYKRLAGMTRQFARDMDNPELDFERAARSFNKDELGLIWKVGDWAARELQLRQDLDAGKARYPWVHLPSDEVAETRRTRPTVYISPDTLTWGADKKTLTIGELSAKLNAMNFPGKLPSERWVIIRMEDEVTEKRKLRILRAIVDAEALPIALFAQIGLHIPESDRGEIVEPPVEPARP